MRHYGGGVKVGATDLSHFEIEMLAKGKRYALVSEDLSMGAVEGCLVEVGCGGAEALLIYSRKYKFREVRGFDIAAYPSNENSEIRVDAANLNATWPMGEKSVDGLIAMMVIEHLFDPFFCFDEIKRVLSNNRMAWVNLPLVTTVRNRLRLMCGRLPITSTPYNSWCARRSWDGAHLHYFSLKAIRDLASNAGLKVTALRGVGRFHHIKSLMPGLLAAEVTFRLEHA